MAEKNFALPLDSNSQQSGEISIKELAVNEEPVIFELNNVSVTTGDQLILITNGSQGLLEHTYFVTGDNGTARVTLSAAQMMILLNDAANGSWDYVRALWLLQSVDAPETSNMREIQNTHPYNANGWPPKSK